MKLTGADALHLGWMCRYQRTLDQIQRKKKQKHQAERELRDVHRGSGGTGAAGDGASGAVDDSPSMFSRVIGFTGGLFSGDSARKQVQYASDLSVFAWHLSNICLPICC